MGNRDEEIIEARRAMQKQREDAQVKERLENEKKESIHEGIVHIYENPIEFERKDFEELGFSVILPKAFLELEDEMKTALYPYGKAPMHVFYGENIPFQFSVNKTENIVPNEGIPKFMGIAKDVMERIGPQSRVMSNNYKSRGKRNIGVMEFSTRALDGPAYNMQFYVSMADNKLVIAALTCPAKKHDRLLPLFEEIVDSVKIYEDEV